MKALWDALLAALPAVVVDLIRKWRKRNEGDVDEAVKKASETGDTGDLDRLTNEVRRPK